MQAPRRSPEERCSRRAERTRAEAAGRRAAGRRTEAAAEAAVVRRAAAVSQSDPSGVQRRNEREAAGASDAGRGHAGWSGRSDVEVAERVLGTARSDAPQLPQKLC